MAKHKKRRLGRVEWLPALLAVVVLAGWWLWRTTRPPAGVAHVFLAEEEILTLPLDVDRTVSLREEFGVPVDFEIADGAIRYVNVDCPDHICERTGWVSRMDQMAVCMPNGVVLTVSE